MPPLLYWDWFRPSFIMTADLSYFHGNGKYPGFRTGTVPTYWQRTPATIKVELLG